ncbi:hypothetical protein [[Limnothrix rosea] IAM M-220]|uniref:hypothetical protein n=1 Tax=[Limnothrix rosea] IAM M-220 TaxID=454133 RepID=UPI0009654A4D|nr:hypothetical protein [[Limnothrix rosea] IAM M-220]OKH19791.1 hypothetical protein NIES208_01305 [[Limnothrix rosea] IAM M-220]
MAQHKFAFGLLVSCLVTGAVSPEAIADDTNPNVMYVANMAKIPMGGVKALQGLDVPVAVSTAVPDEFFLREIELEFGDWGGTTYRLIYDGYYDNSLVKTCFAIEGTNDGVGGLALGNASYSFASSVFGRGTIEAGYYGSSESSTFLGDWVGRGNGYYRFVGAGVYDSLAGCENVSVDQAIAISESLQYLP